jgi:hypothetical protein
MGTLVAIEATHPSQAEAEMAVSRAFALIHEAEQRLHPEPPAVISIESIVRLVGSRYPCTRTLGAYSNWPAAFTR